MGFHQSDIIIRTALIEGIADMRRNPYLIDYVFASLAKDALTSGTYGEKEIARAKKWFLSTNIPVFMAYTMEKSTFPCISISLLESSESETTLADVHYQPSEDNDLEWPALSDPFSPTSYVASTGVMVVPDAVTDNLILVPGMVVVDDEDVPHEILEVHDRNTLLLAPNTVAAFTHAAIKGARPSRIVTIESVGMRESYEIGCHVSPEPFMLMWLHSIVCFILYRYKQSLLEARGFERTVVSSSDFRRNDFFESENVLSRHIKITGYFHQSWPKLISDKITGTMVVPVYTETGESPAPIAPDLDVDSDDSWLVNVDGLGLKAS